VIVLKRRKFLQSAAATGAAASLSGCAGIRGFLNGESKGNNQGTSTPEEESENFRVDFIDETGTLGHVAQNYSTDNESDNAVNNYTEEEWQEFEENDIDQEEDRTGGGVWNDGDIADHLEEIQPFVEYTMEMRDDLPGFNPEEVSDSRGTTPQQIRESNLDWAEKLAWGTGFGIQHNLPAVDSGFEGAKTTFPAIEHFARNLLGREDEIETIATLSTEPNTNTDGFTHLTGVLTYTDDEGEFHNKYLESTIGGGTPGVFNSVIREPHESIYSEGGHESAAIPFEYSKAIDSIESEAIYSAEDSWGQAALSRVISGALRGYVDAGGPGQEVDGEEPIDIVDNWNQVVERHDNGAPVTVSPAFGESLENSFDNYDESVEQKFENIGRGITIFYETFKQGAPLGIGGNVEDPEIYKMNIDKMEEAWQSNYQNLSELI